MLLIRITPPNPIWAGFIFLISFQLLSIKSYAQLSQPQLEALVRGFTQNLSARGIDTICIYEEYCNGCYFYSDKDEHVCQEKVLFLPTYIFWKEKGRTYMTKKDICFDYDSQKISDDSFWPFYLFNREKLKNEELKKPQYYEMINGKKQVKTVDVENAIYFRISLYTGKDSMIKVINNFYFSRELGPNEEINLNHDYNHNTRLNQLHLIFQRIIKNEKEKKKLAGKLR